MSVKILEKVFSSAHIDPLNVHLEKKRQRLPMYKKLAAARFECNLGETLPLEEAAPEEEKARIYHCSCVLCIPEKENFSEVFSWLGSLTDPLPRVNSRG